MRLSRDKIQRMINAGGGSSSGGGGGSDIAGGVTQAWVNQNYVSIEFFRKVFKVWAAGETSSDPDVEIMPNDIASTVKNIQAQAGLWTEAFLSALGQGSGGGTGGATTLDQLDEVVITSPTNGQALIYNATTQMWVNGTIQSGTDMATVWSALAAATSEQINASHLSDVLADYVTATSLQTILGDYLTQTAADQRYITIAYFDRLFRAYNGDTLVSHNDTTTTIDNIKAMFGFWTDMYLSALGRNSAATGLGIDNLTDVTINTPTDGQVLQYNATSSKWENATIQTVVALSGLTDVLLTSVSSNQILIYDTTTQKWVNSSLKTINNNSLIGAGNIDISGGGNGNYLWITSGSSLNADSCYVDSGLYLLTSGSFSNVPGSGYGQILLLPYRAGHGNSSPDYGAQIYIPCGDDATYPNTMFFRTSLRNSWNPWQTVPTISSLSGYFLPLTGGTLTGKLTVNAVIYGNNYINNNNAASFVFDKRSSNNTGIGGHNQNDVIWFGACDSNGNWVDDYKQIWKFNGDIYADYVRIEKKNEINSYYSLGGNGLFINYRTSGNVSIAIGGGSVGIGTEPSYKLHVAGTIYATGAITALSDMREKLVNEKAELPIECIANAPAFSNYWKDKKAHDELLHVGSSAQYWRTVLPDVVLEAKDEKGTLSMQYGVAALVSAITIARKVMDHEKRIKLLEQENEELKKQLNAA